MVLHGLDRVSGIPQSKWAEIGRICGDLGNFALTRSSFFVDGKICGGLGSSVVHSRNFAAYLGSQNSDGLLSQTVATISGATYQINFWLAGLNIGTNIPNDFSVFGARPHWRALPMWPLQRLLISITRQQPPARPRRCPFSRNEFSYFVLDDVSVMQVVTAVPEPTGLVLTTAILAFALAYRIRKSRVRRIS